MNNEILISVLIGVFYLLILLGCIGAMASAWLLWRLPKQMAEEAAKALERDNKRNEFIEDGFKGHVEASKRMLEFMKDGFDGNVELAKQVVEASAKHSEAVMKLDTDNSQKLYDSLVLCVQMLNLTLQGLGYTPKNPDEKSGLQDIQDRGVNHGAPPAPKSEEGLTFSRK